jgi:hypothetical protein
MRERLRLHDADRTGAKNQDYMLRVNPDIAG